MDEGKIILDQSLNSGFITLLYIALKKQKDPQLEANTLTDLD